MMSVPRFNRLTPTRFTVRWERTRMVAISAVVVSALVAGRKLGSNPTEAVLFFLGLVPVFLLILVPIGLLIDRARHRRARRQC